MRIAAAPDALDLLRALESEQRGPQDERARLRRAHGVVTASRNHLNGGQWDDVVAILPRELQSVRASQ